MINSTIFINVPYSSINNENVRQYETGTNIIIDVAEINLSIINKFVGFDNKYIFSLTATFLRDFNIDALLSKLYTLFVLSSSFIKRKKNIPVFLNNANEELVNMQLVKNYFKLQGEEIEFVLFDLTDKQVKNNILLISQEKLQTLNEDYLIEFYPQNIDQIIITQNNITEKNTLETIIKKNRFTEVFLKTVFLQHNNNKLLYCAALWEDRSVLYSSFILLSKKVGENQYYDILNWYHNEYEILPLWYKQFGHIIKIIIGKRSFRSLFSDNVKKYKD